MRSKIRWTYANIMATVAVVIALTGSAYVAYALENNSVKTWHIDNGHVRTQDLGSRAVIGRARQVDGSSIRQISFRSPADNDPTPPPEWKRLFRINGLTVHAYCPEEAEDRVFLRARTNANGSIIGAGALNAKTYGGSEGDAIMFPAVDNVFDANEEQFLEIDDTTTVLSYGNGGDARPVVTATFLANQHIGGTGRCSVVGTVVHSG